MTSAEFHTDKSRMVLNNDGMVIRMFSYSKSISNQLHSNQLNGQQSSKMAGVGFLSPLILVIIYLL